MKTDLIGKWQITEMDLWDAEYLDMEVPAHIDFNEDGTGEFQFGLVRGWMDCRYGEREGKPSVEFSWDGEDEGDENTGRGWAALDADGKLHGRLFIHMGDDSGFVATKQ